MNCPWDWGRCINLCYEGGHLQQYSASGQYERCLLQCTIQQWNTSGCIWSVSLFYCLPCWGCSIAHSSQRQTIGAQTGCWHLNRRMIYIKVKHVSQEYPSRANSRRPWTYPPHPHTQFLTPLFIRVIVLTLEIHHIKLSSVASRR